MLLCRVERLTAGLATRIDHVRKLAAAAVTLEDVGAFHFAQVGAAPTFAHAKARGSQAVISTSRFVAWVCVDRPRRPTLENRAYDTMAAHHKLEQKKTKV